LFKKSKKYGRFKEIWLHDLKDIINDLEKRWDKTLEGGLKAFVA